MWDLRAGVHTAGQHEETRADPHQHPRLPVSPLLLLLAEMEHMRSLGHGYLPHLAAPCTPQFDR